MNIFKTLIYLFYIKKIDNQCTNIYIYIVCLNLCSITFQARQLISHKQESPQHKIFTMVRSNLKKYSEVFTSVGRRPIYFGGLGFQVLILIGENQTSTRLWYLEHELGFQNFQRTWTKLELGSRYSKNWNEIWDFWKYKRGGGEGGS
jgi:hypothetical protein